MYLHTILYKNSFSVRGNLLPGHANRHSKQLIYETNIINIFNNFKKFLIIFNSFFYYNFNFSHSFNFNATCDDNRNTWMYFNTLHWAYYCPGQTEKWFLW